MKNKYYIEKEDYAEVGVKNENLRKNNYVKTLKILNKLYVAATKNDMTLFNGQVKNLAFTGLAGNAPALKTLSVAVCDRNHPENIETFKNSFLFKNILTPLFAGRIENENEKWSNYKKTNAVKDEYMGLNGFEAALKIYTQDPKDAVGLFLPKILEDFVKVDGNNKLIESEHDVNDEVAALDAVTKQITLLKSNEKFKEYYENPYVSDESENVLF